MIYKYLFLLSTHLLVSMNIIFLDLAHNSLTVNKKLEIYTNISSIFKINMYINICYQNFQVLKKLNFYENI